MASRPKILDANGKELSVGDRVRMNYPPPMPPADPFDDGEVLRFTETLAHTSGVEVEWPDMDSTCIDWYPASAAGATTSRCPDLELIQPEETQ